MPKSYTASKLFYLPCLLAFGVFCLTSSCSTNSHPVYRIGILSGLDYFSTISDGFKEKMAEFGYIEGKNVVYDIQKSNVDIASYQNIVKKFLDDKVDLILAFPTEASMEAKTLTKGTKTPVVAVNVFLENTGLVDSIRTPGENITGVCWLGPNIVLKRLEIMQELVPRLSKLWVPYYRGYPILPCQLDILKQASTSQGFSLVEIPATTPQELESNLKQQLKASGPPDAILLIIEPLSVTPELFQSLGAFADRRRIPIGGVMMSAGGYESVFGLTPQNIAQGKQAAFLVHKVFQGAPAGTVPVVSAETYLQINYKAAIKAGLKVDEGLLNRADEVIR
ncbi:MAG: ABC transporter substrate-binding protein [candidate division FCPU426 bacterium]